MGAIVTGVCTAGLALWGVASTAKCASKQRRCLSADDYYGNQLGWAFYNWNNGEEGDKRAEYKIWHEDGDIYEVHPDWVDQWETGDGRPDNKYIVDNDFTYNFRADHEDYPDNLEDLKTLLDEHIAERGVPVEAPFKYDNFDDAWEALASRHQDYTIDDFKTLYNANKDIINENLSDEQLEEKFGDMQQDCDCGVLS